MPLDPKDRARLVEALLGCDCMKTASSRNSVVQDLSTDIQSRLRGGGTSKEEVDEIVRVCLQFPGSLETLMQRIHFFEGDSIPWGHLDQVFREIMTEPVAPASIGLQPAAPNAGTKPPAPEPIQVFFSYSHKDEALRDALNTHLAILKRQKVISAWHDREIPAGTEWAAEIDERMNQAQVILLLISADFLASDYCHEIEMKRALEMHESKEAIVIPIILRPCDWKGALFGKLQALPKDARAVTSWPNQDEAFTNVAEGIRRAIDGLRSRNAPHSTG